MDEQKILKNVSNATETPGVYENGYVVALKTILDDVNTMEERVINSLIKIIIDAIVFNEKLPFKKKILIEMLVKLQDQ